MGRTFKIALLIFLNIFYCTEEKSQKYKDSEMYHKFYYQHHHYEHSVAQSSRLVFIYISVYKIACTFLFKYRCYDTENYINRLMYITCHLQLVFPQNCYVHMSKTNTDIWHHFIGQFYAKLKFHDLINPPQVG